MAEFTATGDYGGEYYHVNDNTSSSDVENKTKVNKEEPTKQLSNNSPGVIVMGKNILNSYRSITYNFTLSALTNSEINNPDTYRESELKYVILKSGGKGYTGIHATPPSERDTRQATQMDGDARDMKVRASAQKTIDTTSMIEGFNKESPGRFDMFIQNVEIETLMSPTENSNGSLATKVKFDVIEPYSVNGFIEALHVSAVAAGYPSYLSACFLLKMEFWGYPDNQDLPLPEKIPNSTRYFPIGLTGVGVEINEKGTKYSVTAVPYNEKALGQPSVIKKPIKMIGTTIKEILENFIENINKQVAQDSKNGENKNGESDKYEIKFVNYDTEKGFIPAPNNLSEISKSKLTELYRDNNLYKLADPATIDKMTGYKEDGKKTNNVKLPESVKLEPNKTVVQFSEGMNISDVITSVIRDSEYVRDILKDIKGNIDEFGMLNYFLIKVEVENFEKIDVVGKKPFQKYTYVVLPHKVHITRIPSFGSQQFNESTLKKLSHREYNYLYSGKNVDVTNFKLNFNTLFFEAVPSAFGNKDVPSSRTGAGPTNDPNVKVSGVDVTVQQTNQVPLQPVYQTPMPTQFSGSNAAQPIDSAYGVLARTMHEAIINSKASMISGEIDILGDPFYISTNGSGNYNGKPAGNGKLINDEVNPFYGEILIVINFRNPVDILPLENGGIAHFDSNRVSFSGVYRVLKVNSVFSDGNFKQKLNIIRTPGQILENELKPTDPSTVLKTSPSPDDSVQPDVSGVSPERRPSETQLERSLPTLALPGETLDYTNTAIGDLSGDLSTLKTDISGLTQLSSLSPMSQLSSIGQAIPKDISSDIRLNMSGLADLATTGIGAAAMIASAANVVTGNIPLTRAAGVLAGAMVGSALGSALQKYNKGSGIGEGVTVPINNDFVSSANATANDVKAGKVIDSMKLPEASLNEFTSSLKNSSEQYVNNVKNTIGNTEKYIGDVGNKISDLKSTLSDPSNIGEKLGINAAALSGLSNNASKAFSKVETTLATLPENINLKQSLQNGLRLDSIPLDKFKNIPPAQPFSIAPDPIPDPAGIVSSKVSNIQENISGISNKVDVSVLSDKFNTARTQIAELTNLPNIKDHNISGAVNEKFGSLTAGLSPLDKLVSRFGKG